MKRILLQVRLKKFIIPAAVIMIILSGCAGGLSRREAAKLYYNLGNTYLDLGQSGKASESYLKALEYDGKMKIASYNLAKAYMDGGKFGEALAVLDRMLKDEPENIIALTAKAFCYYRYGDMDKSYSIYSEILEKDPGNAEALYNSAVIISEKGDYGSALEKLSQLKSGKNTDEKLLLKINFKLGQIYYATGQYELSLEYLDYVKRKEPGNIASLEILFDAYVKTRYFASAVETGNLLLKSDPENKDVLFEMAVIYLTAIEDTSSGIRFLDQAIKAGFSDREKIQILLKTPGLAGKDRIMELLGNEKLLAE